MQNFEKPFPFYFFLIILIVYHSWPTSLDLQYKSFLLYHLLILRYILVKLIYQSLINPLCGTKYASRDLAVNDRSDASHDTARSPAHSLSRPIRPQPTAPNRSMIAAVKLQPRAAHAPVYFPSFFRARSSAATPGSAEEGGDARRATDPPGSVTATSRNRCLDGAL